MNKNQKVQLINGVFQQEEAKEILFNIYSSNINYYKIKNLGSQVRYEKCDENCKNMIPELLNSVKLIEAKIAEAIAKNKKIVINSEISITLSDD